MYYLHISFSTVFEQKAVMERFFSFLTLLGALPVAVLQYYFNIALIECFFVVLLRKKTFPVAPTFYRGYGTKILSSATITPYFVTSSSRYTKLLLVWFLKIRSTATSFTHHERDMDSI